MRSVRCDACGAKAMTAAAKCPTCSHLLDLRDGFGELLPLAYCSSCASYYPEHLGECKWCGTKPERPPVNPKIWRAAGAGLAAILGAVWVLKNTTSSHPKPQHTKAATTAVTTPIVQKDTLADTANRVEPPTIVSMASSDSVRPAVDSAVSEGVVLPPAAPAPEPAAPAPVDAPVVPAPEPPKNLMAAPAEPATRVAATPTVPARRTSRWIRSVSRDWVVIRRDASKSSKIVASIGPNSRVELGESRGGWRRVRTKGLAGWVEPRDLFEVARAR